MLYFKKSRELKKSRSTHKVRGMTTLEYALLAAIIVVALMVGVKPLSEAIKDKFKQITTNLNTVDVQAEPSD
jgi:Flp pilus assembly pilin Flp